MFWDKLFDILCLAQKLSAQTLSNEIVGNFDKKKM